MNFELNEHHKAIQILVRDFAEKEFLPGVLERDAGGEFPRRLLRRRAAAVT